MNTPAGPVIFVSHIHEEKKLGEVVKDWVEDVFKPQGVTAWLSSDRDDLPSGRKWRDEILERLKHAQALVSLLSPLSLSRPWVNIELGAAWLHGTRIIPVCHSGQTFAALPPPFSDFQGFGLEQDDAAQRLLGGVADGLRVKLSNKLHYAQCLSELRRAAESSSGPRLTATAAAPDHLPDEQVGLLIAAAEAKNSGGDGHIQFGDFAADAGISPAVATHHVQQLVKRDLLTDHWYSGGPFYSLTPEGAAWLIEHDKMP